MNLQMSRQYGNCPFRKVGAIDLRPGRVAGIVRDLIADDTTSFFCHKTVYAKGNAGEVIVDEDGNESVIPGPKSSVCAGSMVCLLKTGEPSVAMRMGAALGLLRYRDLEAFGDEIIDPVDLHSPARA